MGNLREIYGKYMGIYMGIYEGPGCVGRKWVSSPFYPMVFMIIIPIEWLCHWEYVLFSSIDLGLSENVGYIYSQ